MTAFETVSWVALVVGLTGAWLGWRWLLKAGVMLEDANTAYDAVLAHKRGELMDLRRRVAQRQSKARDE